MVGRPRLVEDDAIFAATQQALTRCGFARLSLAAIASPLGISAATLVKRFGSKRSLLLAFFAWTNRQSAQAFAVAHAAEEPLLDALLRRVGTRGRDGGDRVAAANLFSFFYETMGQPDFRELGIERARIRERGTRSLLDLAIERGELRPCDTARLAGVLLAAVNGAFQTWVLEADRSLEDLLRDVFDVVIGPLRTYVPDRGSED